MENRDLGYKNIDEARIRQILVELTNALDYKQTVPKHKLAYEQAFDDLCALINDIDNAPRL